MKITQQHLDFIVEYAIKYGATKVLLFGSAFKNPENANDIDIATDVSADLIDMFAGTLEETMRMPIDVVSLSPQTPFTKFILHDSRVLL